MEWILSDGVQDWILLSDYSRHAYRVNMVTSRWIFTLLFTLLPNQNKIKLTKKKRKGPVHFRVVNIQYPSDFRTNDCGGSRKNYLQGYHVQ